MELVVAFLALGLAVWALARAGSVAQRTETAFAEHRQQLQKMADSVGADMTAVEDRVAALERPKL